MRQQDVISFFDRLAPQWDADMIRHDDIISFILDNAQVGPGKDVLDVVADSMDRYSAGLAEIYAKADISKFKEGVDPSAILKMCIFVADGVLNEQFKKGKVDSEAYYAEVETYLELLKANLYK